VASRSGYTVIVVLGLIALGSGGDQGCDRPPPTDGGDATEAGEFSFDPGSGATSADDGDAGGGAGDDFSFEPEPGAPAPSDDDDGDDGVGGEGDDDGDDGDSGASSCNDVVATSSVAGDVAVPGDEGLFSDPTLECRLEAGDDDEAVAALQDALAQCNGQDVVVDGEYGAQTGRAVRAVEQQHGLAADGAYDAATALVMRWPAGDECAPLGAAGG
jgi:hypothetical protein